jgi:hypothetical protein
MSLTLAQMVGNSATVSFGYGGGTANIEYFPGKVTEKTFGLAASFGNITDEASVQTGFQALNEMLIDLIKSWDLFEDEAETQPIPLTMERLAELPYMFRIKALTSILGDIRPNDTAL